MSSASACERALTGTGRDAPPEPGEAATSRSDRAAKLCGALAPSASNRLFDLDAPPEELSDINEYRTWSGPNNHCEYRKGVVHNGESATAYYVRQILPQQARRSKVIGYPAHSEVDVDCITLAFTRGRLSELSQTVDPVAQYVVAIESMRRGCDHAKTALPMLVAAGRSPASLFDRRLRPNETEALIPEALYAAAAVEQVCLRDIDQAGRYLAEAERSGYSWAGRPTY